MTSDRKEVRIKRSTADRLLNGFIERISKVNSDDSYLYRVDRAVVFGSYVNDPDKDMIGDLDIGLKLVPKHEGKEHEELCDLKRRECRSSDLFTSVVWPTEEILRMLRNRSAYISLHMIDTADDEAIFSSGIMEIPID